MLDDLRNLLRRPWRERVRVYLVAVAALTGTMTVFGFDPVNQASQGAAVWTAFAAGVLALVGRKLAGRLSPVVRAKTVLREEAPPQPIWLQMPEPRVRSNHEQDLMTRNLRGV